MRYLVLISVLTLVACGGEHSHDHAAEAHDDHGHAPKYGGSLVELGEHEFQVELLLYPETGTLEAYIWDGCVERAIPSPMKSMTVKIKVLDTDMPIVLKPAENPYAEDKPGEATKFKGQSDRLVMVEHFDGTLAEVTLAGKSFKDVAFHYHPGAGHDCEHDHEH